MRFLFVIPVIFLGMLVGACSGDGGCVPHDSKYCDEGVTYWMNSCGDLEELIEKCQCGCLPDHSGCDPDCSCTPDCLGKECGDDGCGGTCPPGCPAGEHCNLGICECDFVTCGSLCCAQGQECYQGACCTPNCTGRECGDNGCGGSCGDCGANEFCDADGQCQSMPADCRQEPCPKGYYCDLNTGECKPGCISDSDCPQPGSCDLASHTCQCDPGYHLCSDQCLPNDSTDSCGDRCTPCVPPDNGTATCDGVSCGFLCDTGYHQCGQLCLSNYSTDSCGASCTPCIPPAHASATCDGVSCGFVCDTGYHQCGQQCLSNYSTDSCGTGCTPCVPPQNATATCDGISCDFVCDSGYHRCGDQCPSVYSTEACGASCTPCSPPANATATCDGVSCGFVCNTGYHQCGSQCLSDTSPNSCGTRCTPCPAGPAHSVPACINGACDFECISGYHRCGDLCYADSDPTHCGPGCIPCTPPENATAACVDGACDFVCDTGYHRCTDECLSDTSPDSCGTSCTPCPQPPNAYATCDGTSCGYECNSGWHLCDGQCVPDDAVTSCGTSCTPCPAPDPGTAQRATCENGVCGTGCIDTCNAACVDTQSDPAHCGGCNHACGAGQACVEGSCVTTCQSGIGFVDLLPRLMEAGNLSPTDQAPGDIDRDGDIDLVVVGIGGSINVFEGNGDGTFLPAVTYDSMVHSPSRAKLGDFNGDLYPDLATFSNPYGETGQAALFLNAGDGTFLAPVLRTAQSAIAGVAVGDFNKDTNLDMAVTNQTSGTVSVFLGDGAGGLGTATSFSANSQPYAIAAGEFTGDSNLDLVVTNYSSSDTTPWISVLPGNGTGGFSAPIATNGNGSGTYIRVGDVNHDGDLDIVVNHSYDSNLHLGNGNGTFQDPVDLGASDRTGSALADLNNDGHLDWAVNTEGSNFVGTLNVRLGNGDGTFQPVVYQPSVGGSNVDNTSAADYDGDGYNDLSILDGLGSIVVYLNDRTGWFPLPPWWDFSNYPYFLTSGDLNGDGSRDAVVSAGTTGRAYPFLGDGAGDFTAVTSTAAGSYPYYCTAADLDRDGYDDVVMTSSAGGINVLYSSAAGTLSAPAYHSTGSGVRQVAAADLDGDGWTDLVVANEYADTVSVLLNDGNGDLIPAGDLEGWLGTYGVAVGDFNLDGRPDVVSGGYDGVEIFMGNGSGSFRYGVTVSTDAYSVEYLTVADFNNDGRLDVAAAQYWDPIAILLGKGNGEFVEVLTGEEVGGGLQAADMDRDGNTDLIIPGFGVMPGNGDGTFATTLKYLLRGGASAAVVDDVNSDSYWDVLLLEDESYSFSVALGTCR